MRTHKMLHATPLYTFEKASMV